MYTCILQVCKRVSTPACCFWVTEALNSSRKQQEYIRKYFSPYFLSGWNQEKKKKIKTAPARKTTRTHISPMVLHHVISVYPCRLLLFLLSSWALMKPCALWHSEEARPSQCNEAAPNNLNLYTYMC